MSRAVLSLAAGVAALIAVGGGALAKMSEIDGYERAINAGSKEAALAFIIEFPTSHLVGDVIESLRPAVAREVCADVPGNIARARRACERVSQTSVVEPARSPASASTAEPQRLQRTNATASAQPVRMQLASTATPVPPLKPAAASQLAALMSSGRSDIVAAATRSRSTVAAPAFRVQLMSTTSPAETETDWRQLQAAHTDLLGNLDLKIWQVDLGAKGVWFRGLVGPLASRAEAASLCATLKSRSPKSGCLIVSR